MFDCIVPVSQSKPTNPSGQAHVYPGCPWTTVSGALLVHVPRPEQVSEAQKSMSVGNINRRLASIKDSLRVSISIFIVLNSTQKVNHHQLWWAFTFYCLTDYCVDKHEWSFKSHDRKLASCQWATKASNDMYTDGRALLKLLYFRLRHFRLIIWISSYWRSNRFQCRGSYRHRWIQQRLRNTLRCHCTDPECMGPSC